MYNRALKLVRQYHRLSQTELALHLGLSRSFVSELEKEIGGKKPSIDVLERYSTYFSIPLSSLLLFAEAATNNFRDRSRVFAAGKVLKMLEWVAETSGEVV